MITGLSRNGIRVEGIGDGENGKVEIEENTAKSNGLTGILVTGSGHQLKKNESGGSGDQTNGGWEYNLAPGSIDSGGNKANGKSVSLKIPGYTGTS